MLFYLYSVPVRLFMIVTSVFALICLVCLLTVSFIASFRVSAMVTWIIGRLTTLYSNASLLCWSSLAFHVTVPGDVVSQVCWPVRPWCAAVFTPEPPPCHGRAWATCRRPRSPPHRWSKPCSDTSGQRWAGFGHTTPSNRVLHGRCL